MEYTSFLFLLEMIGTVAFASSGALVGIRKNMDIFGVLVLGITTAVGGGCIRDLILGIHPPRMFHSFSYVGAAIVTSCFLFAVIYWKKQLLDSRFLTAYEQAMNTFDAIGLGIFTVTGIRTAMSVSTDFGTFLLIFVGLVTGIGGGMLRDIMSDITPFVLVKHIYACASLAGAFLYILLYRMLDERIAILLSAFVVILIRLLAAHYRWNLPRIQDEH